MTYFNRKNKIFKFIFLLFLNLYSNSIYAENKIVLYEGDSLPPYAIPETDSGASVEIIREAFKTQDYLVKFIYVPITKLAEDLDKDPQIDGASRNIFKKADPNKFSNNYIKFHDCVNTLEENNSIKNMDDLSKSSIIAFQGAKLYLGKKYNDAVSLNRSYREINNPLTQTSQLLLGRINAIVSDIYILNYKIKEFIKMFPDIKIKSDKIKCSIYLNNKPYRAYFKNKKYKDLFDLGLTKIIKNGKYSLILKKYNIEDTLNIN